jgi:hypothetical protein
MEKVSGGSARISRVIVNSIRACILMIKGKDLALLNGLQVIFIKGNIIKI